ncbi:MAG: cytochrome c3 family protein [Bacillota bacterium]
MQRLRINAACLLFFCGLLISGSVYATVSAQAYETPHGPYSQFPAGCAACHVAHAAAGPYLMLQTDITTLCLTCHDGTASVFNVVYVPESDIWGTGVTRDVYGFGFGTTSGAVYHHPVKNTGNPAVGQVLECTDCHNPHGDMSVPDQVYPRLLKSSDGTNSYYQGPDFCLACHGAVDRGFPSVENESVSYWVYTLGNHENSNSAHYDTAKTALQPASGTFVTCAACHYKHASDQKRLLAKGEENLCFKCHNTTANSMNGRNIQAEFSVTKASYHDIYGERTGAKVECSSCHGPHTIGAKSLSVADTTYSQVANPDNTKSVMARVYAVQDNGIGNTVGTFTDFCIKCHDGSPPTATESTTTFVPYTVVFPNISITTNVYGWNKSAYTGKSHDSASTPILCTDCHNSHGSDYPLLQKYTEDTATGECSRCHRTGGDVVATDVYTDLTKTYRHPTLYISGKHSDTENYNNMPLADRHAECADCHDPHRCDSTTAVAPAVYGSIKGVSGATIDYTGITWSSWPPAAAARSLKLGIAYQYELCFKCHSCFSYGSSPPSGETDQAKEFNPNNDAYHAVWGASKIGSAYGKFTGVDRNGNPWAYNSRMYCTDCHGSDSSSAPEGPHGSAYQYILIAPWNPNTSQAGATGDRDTDTSGHLCFKCHDYNYYAGNDTSVQSKFSRGSQNNLHVLSKGGQGYVHAQGCACCHGAVPHGYFRRGILVTTADSSPYTTGVKITSFPSGIQAIGSWDKWDCSTVAGCH